MSKADKEFKERLEKVGDKLLTMSQELTDIINTNKGLVIVSDGSKTTIYQNGNKLKGVVDVKFTHSLNEIAVLEMTQNVIENSNWKGVGAYPLPDPRKGENENVKRRKNNDYL